MGWFNHRGILTSKKSRWAVVALLAILFLPASYFIYMEAQGNFHVITPGQAYRSAQLDRDELEDYIARYHIKSILNLRGRKTRRKWYQDEIDVCRQYNCTHYDLRLSASKTPDKKQIARLMHIFKTAPRPILIHCKGGADRSGLAAAMWQVVVEKLPKSTARKQLSIRFGHMPIGSTTVLDAFFENWQP